MPSTSGLQWVLQWVISGLRFTPGPCVVPGKHSTSGLHPKFLKETCLNRHWAWWLALCKYWFSSSSAFGFCVHQIVLVGILKKRGLGNFNSELRDVGEAQLWAEAVGVSGVCLFIRSFIHLLINSSDFSSPSCGQGPAESLTVLALGPWYLWCLVEYGKNPFKKKTPIKSRWFEGLCLHSGACSPSEIGNL